MYRWYFVHSGRIKIKYMKYEFKKFDIASFVCSRISVKNKIRFDQIACNERVIDFVVAYILIFFYRACIFTFYRN